MNSLHCKSRLTALWHIVPAMAVCAAIAATCGIALGQATSGKEKADKKDAATADAKADAPKADTPEARALAAPDDPKKLPKPKPTARKDDPFADEAAPGKAPEKTVPKLDDPFGTTPSKGKLDDKKADDKKADDKTGVDPFAAPAPKKTDSKPATDPFAFPTTTDPTKPAKTPKAEPDPFPGFDDQAKPAKPGDDSKPDAKTPDKSRPLTDTLSDTKTTEPPPSPGQAELKKGQELLDAGKYAEAIEPLKQAIKLSPPGEAGPLYTLGVAYRMLNRYDDAIEEFTEALKIDAALTDALLRRGVCWYYKDEFTLAQADFEDAAGASTTDPRPLTWKGMTLVKLGQVRDAVNVYSEALRYDNHYAPAHVNRGLAYVALKEYGRAVADFDQAIRSTPKDSSLYYKRGVAQGGLGNWQGAVKSYSEAIRLNPKYADAYGNRSAAYRRLGDAEKAQADATKLQEIKNATGRVGQSAAR